MFFLCSLLRCNVFFMFSSQVQWSQGPRSSPRWRGRAQSEKSNCRQKRSGSVNTVHWLSTSTNKESTKELREGRVADWGEGRRGEPGRSSYPRHGSLPHAFRSQGNSRGQLGKRDCMRRKISGYADQQVELYFVP